MVFSLCSQRMRCLQVKNFHKNEKKGVPQSPYQAYVVERIIATRTSNGEREYLLKWRGYSHRQNTWEPIRNINCRGLIAKFEYERHKEMENNFKRNAFLTTENEAKKQKREDYENNYPGTSKTYESSGMPEKYLKKIVGVLSNVTNGQLSKIKGEKSNILEKRNAISNVKNIVRKIHMVEANEVNGNYEKKQTSIPNITKHRESDSSKVVRTFTENNNLSLSTAKNTLGESNHCWGNKVEEDSERPEVTRATGTEHKSHFVVSYPKKTEGTRVNGNDQKSNFVASCPKNPEATTSTGNDHKSYVAASCPENNLESGKPETNAIKKYKLQGNEKREKDKDKDKGQGVTQKNSKSKSKERHEHSESVKVTGRVNKIKMCKFSYKSKAINTTAGWKTPSNMTQDKRKVQCLMNAESKRKDDVNLMNTDSARNAQHEKRRVASTTAKRGHESLASKALFQSLISKLKPEKIVGATEMAGKLLLLMKCEGRENIELVPAKLAHQLCPQAVIQFYQSHVVWQDPEPDPVSKNKVFFKSSTTNIPVVM